MVYKQRKGQIQLLFDLCLAYSQRWLVGLLYRSQVTISCQPPAQRNISKRRLICPWHFPWRLKQSLKNCSLPRTLLPLGSYHRLAVSQSKIQGEADDKELLLSSEGKLAQWNKRLAKACPSWDCPLWLGNTKEILRLHPRNPQPLPQFRVLCRTRLC